VIEVEFIAFVRPDARLPSLDALVEQMGKDCVRARAMLAAAPARPLSADAWNPPGDA
jgi:hypothetical protein